MYTYGKRIKGSVDVNKGLVLDRANFWGIYSGILRNVN